MQRNMRFRLLSEQNLGTNIPLCKISTDDDERTIGYRWSQMA